jgi:hypothetical protein
VKLECEGSLISKKREGERGNISADCDGEINAMVEGSKFRESHVLKLLSWRAKEGGMPRPLVVHCPYL